MRSDKQTFIAVIFASLALSAAVGGALVHYHFIALDQSLIASFMLSFMTVLCALPFAGWILIERTIRRPLIERMRTDARYPTKAQRQTERRATVLLIGITTVMAAGPAAIGIMQTNTQLTHFVPALVWAWIYYAFGFQKLRFAAIHLLGDKFEHRSESEIIAYTAGLIQLNSSLSCTSWSCNLKINHAVGVPQPELALAALGSGVSGSQIQVPELQLAGLMYFLTRNGDPYRLIQVNNRQFQINMNTVFESSHEQVEASVAVNKSVDALKKARAGI